MPSIGKDKIYNMGGGMEYINCDCIGKCNGEPEINLFNTVQWTKTRCVDNGDGTYRSNIEEGYYCNFSTTQLNNEILSKKGKIIRFGFNEVLPAKRISIIISGTRTGGSAYQEIGTNIGNFNSISDIIANDFTNISSIELRWNRNNSQFTDKVTTISGVELVIGG